MLDVITFWIEATATSFTTLAIAYVIGGQPLQAIIGGYGIKMLPLYYSQRYQIEFVQYYLLGVLIAPLLGGVIAYYSSYRSVFVVSSIVASVLFVYCLLRIAGINTELVNKEKPFKELYYNSNDAKQFIQSYNESKSKSKINNTNDNNINANAMEPAFLQSKVANELRYLISNDYKFPMCIETDENSINDTKVCFYCKKFYQKTGLSQKNSDRELNVYVFLSLFSKNCELCFTTV